MKKSFNRGRNSRSQSNFEPEQLECEVCGCYYVRADQRDEHLLLEHGILPKIPASKNSNKQKHPSFNISSNSSQTNSFRQVAFEILKVEKNKLRDEVLELLNKHQESLPLDSQTIHLGNDLTETNKPQNENNTERQDASRSRIDNEIESDVVLDISVGRKLELEDGSSKIGAEAIEKSENDATNELKRRCDSENDYSSAKRADLGYPILKIEPMEQELPDEHEISDKQLPIRQIRDELTLDKQISANQIPSDKIPSDQIPYEEFSAEQPATEQISENKLTKSQNSNPEKTSYHCLVCSKSFTSQKQYRLHYNSIQHKTIIDGFRRPETGKPHGLRPVYHCATCCIDFPNPSGLVRHFNSKCHRDIFFGVAKRKNENSASECLGVRKPPEPRQLLMDSMSGAGKMNKFSYTNENSQYENSKNENSHKKIKINLASNEDLRQHVLSREFHTPTISESGSHNFSSDPVKLKDTFFNHRAATGQTTTYFHT